MVTPLSTIARQPMRTPSPMRTGRLSSGRPASACRSVSSTSTFQPNRQPRPIVTALQAEEESFNRTLDRGLEIFETVVGSLQGQAFPAPAAFKLYDTYGFPIDLTELLTIKRQQIAALLQVSRNRRRGRHRQRARPGQHQQVVTPGRQQRRVCQDGRADELGRVPGGLHLPADLPGEDFIETRQVIGEYRRS